MKLRTDPALTGRGAGRHVAPTPSTAAAHSATPSHGRSSLSPRGLTEKVVWRPVGDLKPFPGNPRRHPEAQIARLMRSIETIWTNPILVDEAGTILAGHARLEAAKRLGLTEVPTLTIAGLSAAEKRAVAFKPIQHGLVTYRDNAKVYEKYAWLDGEYRDRERTPTHARGDTIQMSFYEVRDNTNPDPSYPCGPWPDDEAAIVHFNTQYGLTVGETFTTLPTGTACADYVLIEQERRGDDIGLYDIRLIPLYKKP